MLAVACNRRVRTEAGTTPADTLITYCPVKTSLATCLRAGPGAHGKRYYDEPGSTSLMGMSLLGNGGLPARQNRTTGEVA